MILADALELLREIIRDGRETAAQMAAVSQAAVDDLNRADRSFLPAEFQQEVADGHEQRPEGGK